MGVSEPGAVSASLERPDRTCPIPDRKLQTDDLPAAADGFYNSLEAPALEKFPVLALYQEFLRENGAVAALMSGSGSTTFAIGKNFSAAESLAEKVKSQFGRNCWTPASRFMRFLIAALQNLSRPDAAALRPRLNFTSANSIISFAAGILNASARFRKTARHSCRYKHRADLQRKFPWPSLFSQSCQAKAMTPAMIKTSNKTSPQRFHFQPAQFSSQRENQQADIDSEVSVLAMPSPPCLNGSPAPRRAPGSARGKQC